MERIQLVTNNVITATLWKIALEKTRIACSKLKRKDVYGREIQSEYIDTYVRTNIHTHI